MSTASAGGHTLSFEYNGDGIRTAKTADGVKHDYITGDNRLLQETWESNKIEYLYDDTGTIFSLYYNGAKFYLIKNLQGDVVELRNSTNGLVARYTYDAYGKCTSVRDSSGAEITDTSNIALINPIRYRGYYFDSETGLYYVSSRYYDPEIGRWINADGFVYTGQGLTGFNMFAYCGDNPVVRVDTNGQFWWKVKGFLSSAWKKVKVWAKNTFGAGSSTTATISKTETSIISDPSPITAKIGTKTSKIISKHGDSSKSISVYANKDAKHPIKSSTAGIKINISNFNMNLSLGLDNIGIYGSIVDGDTTNSLGAKLDISELKISIDCSSTVQWDDNMSQTTYSSASISGWSILAVCLICATGQPLQSPSYAN